jgi:hypothetical protein
LTLRALQVKHPVCDLRFVSFGSIKFGFRTLSGCSTPHKRISFLAFFDDRVIGEKMMGFSSQRDMSDIVYLIYD